MKVSVFTGLGYFTATQIFTPQIGKAISLLCTALQKVHLVHRADTKEQSQSLHFHSDATLSNTMEKTALSTRLGPAEK